VDLEKMQESALQASNVMKWLGHQHG